MSPIVRAIIATAVLIPTVPAFAVAAVHFEAGAPGFVSFTIAQLPTPASFALGSSFTLTNVAGIFEGIVGKRTIDFFNNSRGGGFQVVGGPGITSQQVFIGAESAPFIEVGDSSAQDTATGRNVGLIIFGGGTIGGVAEPAAWALMIGGFGLVGTRLRRRAAVNC